MEDNNASPRTAEPLAPEAPAVDRSEALKRVTANTALPNVPPAELFGEAGSLPTDALRRWASEAGFFDAIAQRILEDLRPLDRAAVERYRHPKRSFWNKEYRFQLLGDLAGRRVLDLGCGEGSNAVLMASFGAHVTGIDLSARSIEVCQSRARLEGVSERTRFLCAPLERAHLPEGEFDVLWGDGVLHHLIPVLDDTLKRLLRSARKGALFVFSEPVSLSPWLRRLRKNVPIHTDATPDERPLERAELAVLERHLPGLKLKWFGALSRLDRFVLPNNNYERASPARRMAADLLGRVDEALLSVPQLRPLGGMAVIHGQVR